MPTSLGGSRYPNQAAAKFAEKVFSYSLQKFGLIFKEDAHSPLFTEDIGNAVVILQLHIRDFLRDYLCRGFGKMVSLIDSVQGFQAMQHLFELQADESLQKYTIHQIFLGYLALITELIIFLDSTDLPVQMDYFVWIWTSIYEKRLKERFAEGWEDLKKESKSLYDTCPNKEGLFEELKIIEHPYAEIDPRIETSFKDVDPFFIFCSLRLGYEFPNKVGLSNEVLEKWTKTLKDAATDV